ncbi:MAG: hypothetical protein FWG64_00325 [Firmicutes bacterium]|nr:hypothetical protein [Bacillota bacterium]
MSGYDNLASAILSQTQSELIFFAVIIMSTLIVGLRVVVKSNEKRDKVNQELQKQLLEVITGNTTALTSVKESALENGKVMARILERLDLANTQSKEIGENLAKIKVTSKVLLQNQIEMTHKLDDILILQNVEKSKGKSQYKKSESPNAHP